MNIKTQWWDFLEYSKFTNSKIFALINNFEYNNELKWLKFFIFNELTYFFFYLRTSDKGIESVEQNQIFKPQYL